MKKKVFTFMLALISGVTINISSPVFAETANNGAKIVTVDGEAAIVESDDVAEKAAVYSALRSAVEQATGVYLMSETKVKNFQTLSDEIYTKADGFVSDYQIISKQKRKDTVWVKVKATVSLEPLVDSLKRLGLLRKWTVAVVMPTANTIEAGYSESALSTLNEIVIDNGFRVVDQDVISSLEKPEILKQLNAGNYMAASKLLRDNGVDILVISKAHSEQIAGYSDNAYGVDVSLNSAKGRLETKVVRCDTGELLASKSFEAKALAGGKDVQALALKNSAQDAGKYLVSQIMKLPASSAAYIQISVKNVSFAKAKELSSALKSIRGVRKVTTRGFRNKEALYEVESDGDVNLLADNISEDKKLTKILKFDINSVSAGKIEATITK